MIRLRTPSRSGNRNIEADIAFIELAEDGMVRHASFKGLKP